MSAPSDPPNGIGQPVRRKEDFRLLTGRGRYGDDLALPRMVYAAFVRSPHAHARIRSVDKTTALAVPGALAVLAGADYVAEGLKPIPHNAGLVEPPDLVVRLCGMDPIAPPHWPLPIEKARFVGEGVAIVLAESIAAAKDMAERVHIDYEPLPAVSRAVDAIKPGAPLLWDEAPDNLCIDIEAGDAAATSTAFARAAYIVRLETWAQRVTGVPLEPRTTVAAYDRASGQYTLYSGTGRGVAKAQIDLAHALGVPAERVRVLCEEMGGSFGTRNLFYPEWTLLAWAAQRIGRPVKWTRERSESFLSDYQGRDLRVEAELALDADGTFLAVRSSHLSNLGAYAATFVPLQKGMGILSAVYHIPVAFVRGCGAFTNTAPTAPYRSAGRPEVIFVIERLIDLAADRLALDPVALRQRNLIPSAAQPYTNPLGLTYDSGDYEQVMKRALALADWQGFPARRAEARRRSRRRGIGIANFVEITTGAPRERAEITVLPDGRVELVMGTMSSGQGHETSFAQLVTEWLGVPFESIVYVAHDTARVRAGGGSNSGRSMKLAATIIGKATDQIIDKGCKIAGILLEAAEADLDFAAGRYLVTGTDREISLFDIAAAAIKHTSLPEELRGPLVGISDETLRIASFPFGTQICEVEVDVETGAVEIVRFVSVDDVGRAVNPMILHGQTHGGIAQGVGQALLEDAHYDPASGQLLTASFMDYAMPRADNLPWLETALSEIPSPTNRLGVRSAGEGGTTPALAAVINAVVDALAELGVSHIELPATPERVWRAIQAVANFSKEKFGKDPKELRVAIIHEDGSYGVDVAKGDEIGAKKHGFNIVLKEGYSISAPDLSALVTKLKRARPDVVFHTGYNPDITLLLRQAREQGLKFGALVGQGAGYGVYEKLKDSLGPDANYIFNVDPISIWLTNPETLDPSLPPVIKMVGEEFDKLKPGMAIRSAHVGMAASNTYLFMTKVLPHAIKKYGGIDAEALRKAAMDVDLSEGGTMLGFGVKFEDQDSELAGQNQRAFPVIIQYVDDKPYVVWPKSKQMQEPVLPLPAGTTYSYK